MLFESATGKLVKIISQLFMVAEVGLDIRLTLKYPLIGSAARFAVPCVRLADKPAALHTDRCTLNGFAASATGSAKPFRPNELRSSAS